MLADFVGSKRPRQITTSQIIEISAKHFGFSVEELIGPSRRRPLVIARQIAMHLFANLRTSVILPSAESSVMRDHTHCGTPFEKILAHERAPTGI